MKRNVITIPNKLLRQRSKRIGFIDDSLQILASDMADTTLDYDKKGEIGVAIAAVQVGEPIRLAVVRQHPEEDLDEDEFITFINPQIVKSSSQVSLDYEGCMSIPKVYGKVERPAQIKVKAYDLAGREVRLNLKGFSARLFAHEIDHMNGVLFIDHVKDPTQLYELDSEGKFKPLELKKAKQLYTKWHEHDKT